MVRKKNVFPEKKIRNLYTFYELLSMRDNSDNKHRGDGMLNVKNESYFATTEICLSLFNIYEYWCFKFYNFNIHL